MYTIFAAIALFVLTPLYGGLSIIHAFLGRVSAPGNFLSEAPRRWSRGLLRAAGVKVVLHDEWRMEGESAHVFVANHVSWFDILVLAAYLPHYKFIAKKELSRIPVFGKGARAVGTIWMERENRKAAFESYKEAGAQIKQGANVVVYPEGTRGDEYALRTFKKGPFVLAIAAQVPVVPTLIHGTIEVLARNSLHVRPGTVHIHFLEAIPTEGLGYDDRERLANAARDRMAVAQRELYGVESKVSV